MTDQTDDTNKIDEAAVPFAAGLDEVWWRAAAAGGDIVEQEKRAVEALDYDAERTRRYYESEGRDQIGGFVSPSLSGGGRQTDWRFAPRGIDWR